MVRTITMERIHACMACGNEVADLDQRTCPHCLEPLRLRTFASRDAYEGYRADRRGHGRAVDPVRRPPRRVLAMVLGFAGVLMLFAATGILVAGLGPGIGASSIAAVAAAIVPLGIGAALFEVARRVGGS